MGEGEGDKNKERFQLIDLFASQNHCPSLALPPGPRFLPAVSDRPSAPGAREPSPATRASHETREKRIYKRIYKDRQETENKERYRYRHSEVTNVV